MRLTYDPKANAAYIRFRDKAGIEVETLTISDEINIDLAADGSLYGIELLNASEQLRAGDDGRLVVIDPESGEERTLQVV
jgi:uncharacterized protein YuzE